MTGVLLSSFSDCSETQDRRRRTAPLYYHCVGQRRYSRQDAVVSSRRLDDEPSRLLTPAATSSKRIGYTGYITTRPNTSSHDYRRGPGDVDTDYRRGPGDGDGDDNRHVDRRAGVTNFRLLFVVRINVGLPKYVGTNSLCRPR